MAAMKARIREFAKDYLFGHELPHRYAKVAQAGPVDPRKVLFVNGKLETVPDAFSVIMPRLQADPRFDVRFVGLGQAVCGKQQYRKRCLALMDELATAKYVFLEDASNVVGCVGLRSETKVVQLWHACGAFKKWGMSTADKKFGNTAENIARHPFYRNLSLVTVSAPEVAWAYREAMMLEDTPEVVQPLGVSRTDVFFDAAFADEARTWLGARFPGIGARKAILYAPTFRGKVMGAQSPDALDIAALRAAIGDGFALIVKHHPFVKTPPPIPDGCEDFAFTAAPDDPIDKLLMCADVLVTDYSSVVFEYSLLGRPMAFFAPDLADYADWRGFYYDYDELTPGPVLATTAELADHLQHLDERFDAAEVDAFRAKFMSACDGHATEQILDAVIGA